MISRMPHGISLDAFNILRSLKLFCPWKEMLNKDEGFKMAGVLQSQVRSLWVWPVPDDTSTKLVPCDANLPILAMQVNSLEAFVKKQDQILTAAYNSTMAMWGKILP